MVISICKSHRGSQIMKNVILKFVLSFSICLSFTLSAFGQITRAELEKKVDAIIAQAYKEASAKFPCKLSTSGKVKMGNWKDVENCVNSAHDLVEWETHAAALKKIREDDRISMEDITLAIEAALTKHAILYDKVFLVKKKEESVALLPLSNSLLKFLPEKSLTKLLVYDKDGTLRGTFLATYAYERSGGMRVLNEYRMVSFQYTDTKGEAQTPNEAFLIDLYGVPWRDAWYQPGFRLPSNKLFNWR